MTDHGLFQTVEGIREFDQLTDKYPSAAALINGVHLTSSFSTNKIDERGYYKHTVSLQLFLDATCDLVSVTIYTDYKAGKPTQAIFRWERLDETMRHILDGESTVYDLPLGNIHPRMLELHEQFAKELAAKYLESLLENADLI